MKVKLMGLNRNKFIGLEQVPAMAILLTEDDKKKIAAMPEGHRIYIEFDNKKYSTDKVKLWANEGTAPEIIKPTQAEVFDITKGRIVSPINKKDGEG